MKKTTALREASLYVGDIQRTGKHSYVFYAPFKEPGGPTTEVKAESYDLIRLYRTQHLVWTAIDLMGLGKDPHEIDWQIYQAQQHLGISKARNILNHVLEKLEVA
jgi:hypothetical protein